MVYVHYIFLTSSSPPVICCLNGGFFVLAPSVFIVQLNSDYSARTEYLTQAIRYQTGCGQTKPGGHLIQ